MNILCWLGLHSRRGWETDYSRPYVPMLSVWAPHLDRMKSYRQFNRCMRCGDVKCQFTRYT